MRSCARTACRWPAAATLSYRYATQEVWLADLDVDHPSTYDLCPHHAERLTVPRGWQLIDLRSAGEAPPREPSAAEIVERAARLRSGVQQQLIAVGGPLRRSRYDALLAELPVHAPHDPSDGEASEQPEAEHVRDEPVLVESGAVVVELPRHQRGLKP